MFKIKNISSYSVDELSSISCNSEYIVDSLLGGIGAIGTLMFEASCNENDNLDKDTIGELGLLINQAALISEIFRLNEFSAEVEIEMRRKIKSTQ